MTEQAEQEQPAPVDWQGIAKQRERELKAVGERKYAVEQERDGAYRERAHLVAWLAALHPAVIAPAPDVDEPGWQILYLRSSTHGWQMTWHIHPRDAGLFTDVEHVAVDDPRAQWDGHSTEQKYNRMRAHIRVVHMNNRLGATSCPVCEGSGRCPACRTTMRATSTTEELSAVIERIQHAVFIADDEDVTDWQRGFRSCAGRVLHEINPAVEEQP